ncbi:diadenylate cyclase [Bacillus thuringiensis]|uniref:diadenylate cyclase n=1 Tax=Bacillus thuringiensis TaxID=1428 RepID=UPI0021D65365|nr:diadenylate cyclase [Bacillus thuringiensis]MCU7666879.1 diadenylate cyclase [Bacillus thuringiensis]
MLVIQTIDVCIVLTIICFIYTLIKKTEAFNITIGLLILFLVYFITEACGLTLTATIFKRIFELSSFGLVLIFHPELRMVLKKIGGITSIPTEKKEITSSMEEAVFSLSKDKIGALIIFDPEERVTFQTDDMVKIDAVYSNELLETIFFKNTPLHDGAVIIQNGKIAYAGCKLPLTAKKREEYGNLGTRHLAALETAEMFGVTGIVVSEETGSVSIATNRGIRKVESKEKFRLFFKKQKKNMFKKLTGKK